MSDVESDAVFPDHDSLTRRRRGVSPFYDGAVKRGVDLSIAVLLLPLAVPAMLALWLLATLDGGPGLFGHVRVGRNGRTFTCWKIRSMVPDAERRLARHLADNPEAAEEWAQSRKLGRDPRVTTLGRLMRVTSMDELPQIWNVLVGDMSFVGPRPVTEDELDRYGVHRRHYLHCRPGLTGLWQVSGRNSLSFEDRIAMDRRYAESMGFMFDMGLMLRTVPVVVRLSGR